MTTSTVQKINEIDLGRFRVVFGPENGENIYREYLHHLTNRERAVALGYNTRAKCSMSYATGIIKKGSIKASRVKKMCDNLNINPLELKSKYASFIEMYIGSRRMERVDETTEKAIWNTICDGHDNKS